MRQLQASEADSEHARKRVLDVPALEDRRELPQVPARAREGMPGLRQGDSVTTVLPSAAMRTLGAARETVPENEPVGAPPPLVTALALPFRPAATRQLIS